MRRAEPEKAGKAQRLDRRVERFERAAKGTSRRTSMQKAACNAGGTAALLAGGAASVSPIARWPARSAASLQDGVDDLIGIGRNRSGMRDTTSCQASWIGLRYCASSASSHIRRMHSRSVSVLSC